MQIVAYVFFVRGINVLYRLLPGCPHLVSRCLATVVEHVVAKVGIETFLLCAVCAGIFVSTAVSIPKFGFDASAAAAMSLSPTHGEKERKISFQRYDWSSLEPYSSVCIGILSF